MVWNDIPLLCLTYTLIPVMLAVFVGLVWMAATGKVLFPEAENLVRGLKNPVTLMVAIGMLIMGILVLTR